MVKSADISILYNSFQPPLFILPVWGSLVCCIFDESMYLFPRARRHVARVLLVALSFLISSAHHDGQRLWLIASSVGMPLPILMAPLHPNTMGDAPMRRFGRNQRWRRVIGGFC
jgi:hypothetical protein